MLVLLHHVTSTQGVYSVPKPGDGQSGIDASCGSALKDVLVRVYRSNSEPTKPWQQRLRQALETMGAEAAAASAQRHLDRAAARWDYTLGVTGMVAWQDVSCKDATCICSCTLTSASCQSSFADMCGIGNCESGLPAGRRELHRVHRELQAKAQPLVVVSRTHHDRVTKYGGMRRVLNQFVHNLAHSHLSAPGMLAVSDPCSTQFPR